VIIPPSLPLNPADRVCVVLVFAPFFSPQIDLVGSLLSDSSL